MHNYIFVNNKNNAKSTYDYKVKCYSRLEALHYVPISVLNPNIVINFLNRKNTSNSAIFKCLNIIKSAISYCKAKGLYHGIDNFSNYNNLLVKNETVHYKSINYKNISKLFESLEQAPLHLCIYILVCLLTHLRRTEVLNLKFSHIQEDRIVVPKELLKTKPKQDHHIPITKEFIFVIGHIKNKNIYLFESSRKKDNKETHISTTYINKLIKEYCGDLTTLHGFRSSARDFYAENDIENDVAEIALTHNIGTKTTRAYYRSDLFEKRQIALNKWAKYIFNSMTPNFVSNNFDISKEYLMQMLYR